MTQIALSDIRLDGGTQPRASIHQDWIKEYAEDMVSGAKFPPVILFFDGTSHWLADGFHRTHAAEASGATSIEADVRQGTQRDAILFSVSANASHGQRRTNDDKRRAVLCLLNDPEWGGWSDNAIARKTGVSQPFVSGIRPKPEITIDTNNGYKYESRATTFTHPKTGQPAVMNTANIGRRPAPAPQPSRREPPAPPPVHYERTPRPIETIKPPAESPVVAPPMPPRPVAQFDHDAAAIRNKAMDAIRALADQPAAQAVIDAWMKHGGYGEPVATINNAIEWLAAFLPLYQEAEPRRWADCQERLKRVA